MLCSAGFVAGRTAGRWAHSVNANTLAPVLKTVSKAASMLLCLCFARDTHVTCASLPHDATRRRPTALPSHGRRTSGSRNSHRQLPPHQLQQPLPTLAHARWGIGSLARLALLPP